jgi:hypothetical protein
VPRDGMLGPSWLMGSAVTCPAFSTISVPLMKGESSPANAQARLARPFFRVQDLESPGHRVRGSDGMPVRPDPRREREGERSRISASAAWSLHACVPPCHRASLRGIISLPRRPWGKAEPNR